MLNLFGFASEMVVVVGGGVCVLSICEGRLNRHDVNFASGVEDKVSDTSETRIIKKRVGINIWLCAGLTDTRPRQSGIMETSNLAWLVGGRYSYFGTWYFCLKCRPINSKRRQKKKR